MKDVIWIVKFVEYLLNTRQCVTYWQYLLCLYVLITYPILRGQYKQSYI